MTRSGGERTVTEPVSISSMAEANGKPPRGKGEQIWSEHNPKTFRVTGERPRRAECSSTLTVAHSSRGREFGPTLISRGSSMGYKMGGDVTDLKHASLFSFTGLRSETLLKCLEESRKIIVII